MLFYGEVRLAVEWPGLNQLLDVLGPELLLRLVEDGYLRLSYLTTQDGIHTADVDTPRERHMPSGFSMPDRDYITLIQESFANLHEAKPRAARRMAARLINVTDADDVGSLSRAATRDDLRDQDYLTSSIRTVVESIAPGVALNSDFYFRAVEQPDGWFVIDSNISLDDLNRAIQARRDPSQGNVTYAHLLTHLLDVRTDIALATQFDAEIATTDLGSRLIAAKATDLLWSHSDGAKNLAEFKRRTMPGGRGIAEAINSGDRSIEEFLTVLDRSRRLREWIADKDADTDLVQAYFDEVTAGSWITSLPAKSMRWLLLTGAGVVFASTPGVIAAGMASAADAFLLDRMVRGWRPNSFVEGPVRRFATSD
jgi:hypothetical protein